jgi:hypothetical protein
MRSIAITGVSSGIDLGAARRLGRLWAVLGWPAS